MTPTAAFSKKFKLNTDGLLEGSATELEFGVSTASDVLMAIAKDEKFPARRVDLAHVSLGTAGGKDIKFGGGKGSIAIKGKGSIRAQLGVMDKSSEVLEALALPDAKDVGIALNDTAGVRYALLLAGYEVEGSAEGSHPIGVVSSVKFSVEARRERTMAVVRRFNATDGADTVLTGTFRSFGLVRSVRTLADLAPGAMLITEVEGSIGVKIGAQLGYDFSFVREAKALGLTGDVGLKLETGLKVAIGFSASGRYLVALDRESLSEGDHNVRLRLFKLSKRGWDFGLDLSSKVQGVADILPKEVDDLTKAVFGVHGQQVLKDLKLIEEWTSAKTDLSEKIAGLTTKTGFDLLNKATGLDAKTQFDKAHAIVVGALKQWDELPDKVSALMWKSLGDAGLAPTALKQFKDALKGLASTDAAVRKQTLDVLLPDLKLGDSLIGKLLEAGSDKGLDFLAANSERFQPIAATVLNILNGGVIQNLQEFITERLKLEKILDVATKTDFAAVDDWLKNRLSTFLDEKLEFERLDEIKLAINAVITKRQEIYAKARQALTKQYDFSISAKYQKTTEKTALLDATFDLSKTAAQKLLALVVGGGDFDTLLTTVEPSVTLHRAVLTHGIQQSSSVQINFPFYNFTEQKINNSLAKVSAVEEGGRVLFYELDSTDLVTVKNRSKGQLMLAATVPFQLSGVRVHSVTSAKWSYEYKTAKKDMRREELEYLLGPVVNAYLPDHFGGTDSSLSAWITDLDNRVEQQVQNGANEFGDVLLSLEVSQPAATVGAWFTKRDADDLRRARMAVSRELQASLRKMLYFYYLQDLEHVRQNEPGSALLVYAAMPVSTNVRMTGSTVQLNADLSNSKENNVYWDWRDLKIRSAMANHPATQRQLAKFLVEQEARLKAAGFAHDASFFRLDELDDFISSANVGSTTGLFDGLLEVEATIVKGASDALEQIQGFHKNAGTAPSKAIEALAEFGAEITKTFNQRLSSVYGGGAIRPLGSMVFLEASRVLDASLATKRPNAMLALTVLKEERKFEISDFLQNKLPEEGDVALAERLVT